MKRPDILLVEDEQHIIDFVLVYLEQSFDVDIAMDGDTGLEHFLKHRPDLVVLDLGLPGLDGLELFKVMRRHAPTLPVIMLTARSDEIDRVIGLELGADDYVTKPFSGRELAVRIKNLLRRTHAGQTEAHETHHQWGPFLIKPDAGLLCYFGRPVQLTRVEFNFMELLIRHPSQVFTREHLIDRIYQDEYRAVTTRSIDAYVKRIRKKFAEVRADLNPIETVHSFGYKLNQSMGTAR